MQLHLIWKSEFQVQKMDFFSRIIPQWKRGSVMTPKRHLIAWHWVVWHTDHRHLHSRFCGGDSKEPKLKIKKKPTEVLQVVPLWTGRWRTASDALHPVRCTPKRYQLYDIHGWWGFGSVGWRPAYCEGSWTVFSTVLALTCCTRQSSPETTEFCIGFNE
jgi:hypothetical protein